MRRPTSQFRILAAAALVAGGVALPASGLVGGGAAPDPGAAHLAAEDTYESLLEEYQAAEARYEKALEEASREERRELRKNRPVVEFWPRFSELASKNDGQSLLWLATNMRQYRPIKASDRAKALKPIFDALVEHHADAEWFGGTFDALSEHAERIGTEAYVGYVDAALEKIEDPALVGKACYLASSTLREDDPKRAAEYEAMVLEADPAGYWGTMIRASKAKESDSVVGEMAPDFTGRTYEGNEFKLSDFRGKVVLLDFYGFW